MRALFPQELVTNFFHEKVGVCICKHRKKSKSKYRPTFSILRVCDKFLCLCLRVAILVDKV